MCSVVVKPKVKILSANTEEKPKANSSHSRGGCDAQNRCKLIIITLKPKCSSWHFPSTLMSQRYIPPSARRGHSVHSDRTEQRSLSEVAASLEAEIYIVKLKSKNVFCDIPAPLVENDSQGTTGVQKFKLTFDQGRLKEIFKWFRGIGRKDTNAILEFPPGLNKGRRQQIHQLAQNFGLGTSSQGFGDQHFISVYSIEKSVLGVGKMRLTRDEQEQAEELWRLIKEGGNPKLFRFSLNEIREMILADQLDPALQELWDRKHSLALADDLSRKCCVEDTE